MRRLSLLLTILFLLPTPSALCAEPASPGPRDRCPVCGMFVAPYPEWIAAISFADGRRLFFDGPKDLFRYYFAPTRFGGREQDDITGITVTEYYSTEPADGRTVFYVLGSDVHGPMGHELIPLSTREQAETFSRDHGGKKILTFPEVTAETLSAIP